MNAHPSNTSLHSLRNQITKKGSDLSLRKHSRRGSRRDNNAEVTKPRSQFSISKNNSRLNSEENNKLKDRDVPKGTIEFVTGIRNDPDFFTPSSKEKNTIKGRRKSQDTQNPEGTVVREEKITRVQSKVVTETETQLVGDDSNSRIPIKSSSKSSIHKNPSLKRKTSKTRIVKKDKDDQGRDRISETVVTKTITTTTRKKSTASVNSDPKFPNQNNIAHLREFNTSLDEAKEKGNGGQENLENKGVDKAKNRKGGIDPGVDIQVSGPNGTWGDLGNAEGGHATPKPGRTSAKKRNKNSDEDDQNIFANNLSPTRKKKTSKSVGAKKGRSKTKGKKYK